MPRLAAGDYAAFVAANTAVLAPPLVPELRLHLATAMVPIWEATEAGLAELAIQPPYWAFAWPGGQAIARHLLDHPALVTGLAVLDFAAGSGLAGIAAARAGAARVVATEIDPLALAAIRLNAALNGVVLSIDGRDHLAGAGASSLPAADVVLAGDVCYERGLADRIWLWLRAQAAAGAVVLLGDPGRAYLPKAGLVPIATYTVPTSLDLEDREARETTVWRLA
jgi:predicted nicotinamide N-methyase